jgi:hypothetical protein
MGLLFGRILVMIIRTNAGPYRANKEGNIDYHARWIFTAGHCHSLAVTLNKLTGWPICGHGFNFYDDPTFADMPGHMFVHSPKGYLGITGIMEWHSVYSDVRVMTIKEVRHWISLGHLGGYRKPNYQLARPYAERLLLNYFPELPFPITTVTGRR